MVNELSFYEQNQVEHFLYELYCLWGGSLDEDMCIGEGWIVYLEGREKYQYDVGDAAYWEYVQRNVKERLSELKQIRSRRIRLESRLSLNQTFGDTKEEVGCWLAGKSGDFVNSIALWDYAKRLGSLKYEVLKLMYGREDDYNIMRILELDKENYYEIKKELRKDFLLYIKNMDEENH